MQILKAFLEILLFFNPGATFTVYDRVSSISNNLVSTITEPCCPVLAGCMPKLLILDSPQWQSSPTPLPPRCLLSTIVEMDSTYGKNMFISPKLWFCSIAKRNCFALRLVLLMGELSPTTGTNWTPATCGTITLIQTLKTMCSGLGTTRWTKYVFTRLVFIKI